MIGGMATLTAWNTLPHTPSALLLTARRLPFRRFQFDIWKPSGNTAVVKVSANLNSYNRRHPNGKKAKKVYRQNPRP